MYALVVEVSIDPDRSDDAERMLHEAVVPMISAQDGFVSGYWRR